MDVDLALALTTGMVATVNPCGFAMLPAYLSFFIGVDHDDDARASIGRALIVGTAVTVGFASTFAVVGLVVARLTERVYEIAPWISLVIGAGLLVLGVVLLLGHEIVVPLPRLDKGGRTRGLVSMALFGVSYAVASIGCELPLFLAAMTGVFGHGLASGVAYFTAFAVGFGLVLTAITVGLAMARQSVVHSMRKVLPYVSRVAGGLLVLTGVYIAWYGWAEISSNVDDPTVSRVNDWSASAATWLYDNWLPVAIVLAGAVATAIVYVVTTRQPAREPVEQPS